MSCITVAAPPISTVRKTRPKHWPTCARPCSTKGLSALIGYMDDKGIDPAKHAVEFTRFEPILHGRGLDVDKNGRTYRSRPLRRRRHGRQRGLRSRSCRLDGLESRPCRCCRRRHGQGQRGSRLQSCHPGQDGTSFLLYGQKDRCRLQEANIALTQIMSDYANVGPYHVRSESLLKAGLGYLALAA